MRTPSIFTNPATGATYLWPVNHDEEDATGKSRQMSDGAPSKNVGLIPQQGAPTPLVLSWKGKIFTKAQVEAMIAWWELCEDQSIYVTDPAGSTYEVLITDFTEQRQPVAANRWDPVNAPTWIWTYTLVMRVLNVLSGEWSGVTS